MSKKSRRNRIKFQATQTTKRQAPVKPSEVNRPGVAPFIKEITAKPSHVMDESELNKYIVSDLRRICILGSILIIIMIVASLIIK